MKTPAIEEGKKQPKHFNYIVGQHPGSLACVDDTAKSGKHSARTLMKVGPEIGAVIRTEEWFCRHRALSRCR